MTTETAVNAPPLPAFARQAGDVEDLLELRRRAGVYERVVKPAIDKAGAAVLLSLLAPLILGVAIAVVLRLGHPVLFKQQRVGQGGAIFNMYKFRTMHPDRRGGGDRRNGARPSAGDRRQTHKSANDPRHTPLGLLLRRLSMDELPQLWNVLRGEMSLVGPRPELERVVAGYEQWQHRRHDVRPGMTGLWQVTERGGGDGVMHLHVDIDLHYIRRMSLFTDLAILAKTLPAAFGRGG